MSRLEQEFPGKVMAHNVDATTPEARKVVQDLGFKSHGLTIRSAEGIVLFKQPDHTVRMEGVVRAIKEILRA